MIPGRHGTTGPLMMGSEVPQSTIIPRDAANLVVKVATQDTEAVGCINYPEQACRQAIPMRRHVISALPSG